MKKLQQRSILQRLANLTKNFFVCEFKLVKIVIVHFLYCEIYLFSSPWGSNVTCTQVVN